MGYFGTDPKTKQEIDLRTVREYIEGLLNSKITNVEIKEVFLKIGIDTDALRGDRIILKNDRKRGKLCLRMK